MFTETVQQTEPVVKNLWATVEERFPNLISFFDLLARESYLLLYADDVGTFESKTAEFAKALPTERVGSAAATIYLGKQFFDLMYLDAWKEAQATKSEAELAGLPEPPGWAVGQGEEMERPLVPVNFAHDIFSDTLGEVISASNRSDYAPTDDDDDDVRILMEAYLFFARYRHESKRHDGLVPSCLNREAAEVLLVGLGIVTKIGFVS